MSTESYDLDLGPEEDEEHAAIVVQAASDITLKGEVITPSQTVNLAGRDFRVADKVGLMPLLKFSHAANLSTDDERAYVAMYQILRDVIKGADKPCGDCQGCEQAAPRAPTHRDCLNADHGDWDAFEDWAVECKADADDLLDVVGEAIKLISARPTTSPGSSSRSSRKTSRKSTGSSSGQQARESNGSRRGRRAT